ncbi:MAG: zinc-ribbon domain-containing protein, partial [Gammaproteobacteria bacterium]|nr:zinc-ribbon domain-containing protein [Gammaproteobacteria bacterium]
MIISCNKCSTSYNVNDKAIKKKEFKVRCGKCKHVFVVTKEPPTVAKTAPKPVEQAPVVIEGMENVNPSAKAKIISVCNQKGGVAKTSTCMNLASSLLAQEKRVLLIDFDVQANLSLLLGCKNKKSFFEVMDEDDGDLTKAIIKTKHGLWLLPSNSKMALASKKYINEPGFE